LRITQSRERKSVDKFEVILSPQAVKDLDSLGETVYAKIVRQLQSLRDNPFPRGKKIKKIKGTRLNYYRLRVDKNRVFYVIEGDRIIVLRILRKKDVDRFLGNLG
jgi:mRNA interferase RelE/StbE